MATVTQMAATQGMRGRVVVPVRRPSAGPPKSPRKWHSFADRSPPGTAMSSGGPRKTQLRWTSQEPTKVATASQIAAPQKGEVS